MANDSVDDLGIFLSVLWGGCHSYGWLSTGLLLQRPVLCCGGRGQATGQIYLGECLEEAAAEVGAAGGVVDEAVRGGRRWCGRRGRIRGGSVSAHGCQRVQGGGVRARVRGRAGKGAQGGTHREGAGGVRVLPGQRRMQRAWWAWWARRARRRLACRSPRGRTGACDVRLARNRPVAPWRRGAGQEGKSQGRGRGRDGAQAGLGRGQQRQRSVKGAGAMATVVRPGMLGHRGSRRSGRRRHDLPARAPTRVAWIRRGTGRGAAWPRGRGAD